MTQVGMILGTAAYMAPEQARGKAVDKRADIWAFGVVLYEMLTGRAAFAGDTVTDILAAVVTREPDWTALPPTTPASIRRLLARCLDEGSEAAAARHRRRAAGDRGGDRARIRLRHALANRWRSGAAHRRRDARTEARVDIGRASRWRRIALGAVVFSGVWPRARPADARPLRVSIVHT